MKPREIMLIAGEPSGDALAAELVEALRPELAKAEAIYTPEQQPLHASLQPRFFGAGGARMAAAGVDVSFDLTRHAVVGLWEPLKALLTFRRIFWSLYRQALHRRPDAIILVDFGGFNLRFARAIRRHVGRQGTWFINWQPKLIQYVSPQVWASREGRANQIERDYDLLLSTLPFEKSWYAEHAPNLQVEWVGHPIMDRYDGKAPAASRILRAKPGGKASIALFPGSRVGELRRHLPLLAEVVSRIGVDRASFQMIVPNEGLAGMARTALQRVPDVQVRVGGVDQVLSEADLAITKSGTITLECAFFGVPAVVFYRTSSLTYAAARYVANVQYLAMPNLMAGEPLFPEFIQGTANAENLTAVALDILNDPERQERIKARLAELVSTLGGPGAGRRAARHITALVASDSARPLVSFQ